jgi:3,4-dihydroxy 2-butanone 4-phosphate synthase/GTP cyclohydrolase II
MTLATVEEALKVFREEGMVLVMDSIDRENECDLVLSAEAATPEKMAFVIKHSTGIVCMVSDEARMKHFGLHKATINNTDPNGTNFYVATDYIPGTTTGVSAADRVATLKAFGDLSNKAEDFSKPGHMFPLAAKPGGVLERGGHTESAYDLCKFAGLKNPVSAIGELMKEDGTMYRLQDSIDFGKKFNLPIITVDQLKEYAQTWWDAKTVVPKSVEPLANIRLESMQTGCTLRVFGKDNEEIVALIKGDLSGRENVPTRIHSECFTGDILGSTRCDCGKQLHKFLGFLEKEECGVLLYIRGHEGRGIGLTNKIRAYNLQDNQKLDTLDANLALGFEADERDYEEVRNVLIQLGIVSVNLYTNNPLKIEAMKPLVSKVSALGTIPEAENLGYLQTKEKRMNHKTVLSTLHLPELKGPVGQFTVGIVHTSWNESYVQSLLISTKQELELAGVNVVTLNVPGAFDLIGGARIMHRKNKNVHAIVALGLLLKGDSDQHEHMCSAVANGLGILNTTLDVPVISGVLMCKNEDQAQERCFGKQNSGVALARTAVHLVTLNADAEVYP